MSSAKFCLCSVSVNITPNRHSLLHLHACTWQWQSLVGENDIYKRFTKVFDFSLLSSMVIGSLGNSPVLSCSLSYLNCVTSKEQVENGMLRSIWRLKVRTGTPTWRPIHHRTDLTRLFVLTYTHILMPSPETTDVEAPWLMLTSRTWKGLTGLSTLAWRHTGKQKYLENLRTQIQLR